MYPAVLASPVYSAASMQYTGEARPALFAPSLLDNRTMETLQNFPQLPFFTYDASLALAQVAPSLAVPHAQHQPSESVVRPYMPVKSIEPLNPA